jgi:hypothetical protein
MQVKTQDIDTIALALLVEKRGAEWILRNVMAPVKTEEPVKQSAPALSPVATQTFVRPVVSCSRRAIAKREIIRLLRENGPLPRREILGHFLWSEIEGVVVGQPTVDAVLYQLANEDVIERIALPGKGNPAHAYRIVRK